MGMKVEVHSKAGCGWCDGVKRYLSAAGVAFTEIPHDDDAERARFYDGLGLVGATERTVPQVIVIEDDGSRRRIGGFMETLASDTVYRWRKLAVGQVEAPASAPA